MTQKVRRHSEQSEESSYFFYFDSRLNRILHIRSGKRAPHDVIQSVAKNPVTFFIAIQDLTGSYRLRLQDGFGMYLVLVIYSVKMVKISYFT